MIKVHNKMKAEKDEEERQRLQIAKQQRESEIRKLKQQAKR